MLFYFGEVYFLLIKIVVMLYSRPLQNQKCRKRKHTRKNLDLHKILANKIQKEHENIRLQTRKMSIISFTIKNTF